MKQIFSMMLVCLFFIPAIAQKSKKDLVYLKSGAVIRGELVTNDAEDVKIFSSGNYWVFKQSEVDSVRKYSKLKPATEQSMDYFFDTSAGVLVGNSGNNQSAPFSFMTAFNYKISQNWYAGLGLGAEFLEETYMPAFAQFQYKFRDARFTPFLNILAGYQIAVEDGSRNQLINNYDYVSSYWPGPQASDRLDAKGGFLINPSIGFQRYTSENFGWFFAFGYRHHQLNYTGNNDYKLETNFSRLSLKIGFIFN